MTDQTQKAVSLAHAIRDESRNLMLAYRRLRELKERKERSGINFTDYNGDYAIHPNLQHLDGTVLDNVLASTTSLGAFITENGHDDNFERAALI